MPLSRFEFRTIVGRNPGLPTLQLRLWDDEGRELVGLSTTESSGFGTLIEHLWRGHLGLLERTG